jgi:hypothetical protein
MSMEEYERELIAAANVLAAAKAEANGVDPVEAAKVRGSDAMERGAELGLRVVDGDGAADSMGTALTSALMQTPPPPTYGSDSREESPTPGPSRKVEFGRIDLRRR